MRLPVGFDDQAVLLVEDVVPGQVVEHDGVVLAILVWELGPDEGQRLAVEDAYTQEYILRTRKIPNPWRTFKNLDVGCEHM